jgi:anti-sigma B factor antagonist
MHRVAYRGHWRLVYATENEHTSAMEGVLVVDCSGRLVFGEESASLRDMVKKLLAESPKVVMNLREVNHIDSGGLGTLVSLYTTARNAGGAVKLASLSQRVPGDLLQVTKLLTVFEVFDDEEAAARSFSCCPNREWYSRAEPAELREKRCR